MKNRVVITIDGPSAAGKGSLARNLAVYLDFSILDSGALYRAYAYFHSQGLENKAIENEIEKLVFIPETNDTKIFYKDNNITSLIRNEEIAKVASQLSALSETRESLIDIQRNFMQGSNLIADGRDMGTVVFPEAELKIFLIASSEVRAKRRYLELQNRGQEVNMRDLIVDIEHRDMKDKTRILSPLIPAEDSIIVDSSKMSLEEVLSFTKKLTKKEFDK
ncbi:(d)CMP kinase [Gammaproteobacteria bacterium]|nr:(d)CMP kinase [Gammaproteobacteria bacterium]